MSDALSTFFLCFVLPGLARSQKVLPQTLMLSRAESAVGHITLIGVIPNRYFEDGSARDLTMPK